MNIVIAVNVITFGPSMFDHNNGMTTINDGSYLVIFSKWELYFKVTFSLRHTARQSSN